MTADIFLTSRFGPARSVDLARVAERAGFGGVWLAEHYFVDYGKCPSATVLAGSILAATTRIRVGTAACVMSARDPIRLALEASMLNELAGERFQLGVARGGPWKENELLGGGMERYHHGFPAWLETLRAYYPGPVRVAATSASTVELAARHGMPLLLGVENDDESAKQKIEMWARIGGDAVHPRVVLAHHVRADLERWLATIGDPRRDLTAHVDHLMTSRPTTSHPIYMVEAAGTYEKTAELMEKLACAH